MARNYIDADGNVVDESDPKAAFYVGDGDLPDEVNGITIVKKAKAAPNKQAAKPANKSKD